MALDTFPCYGKSRFTDTIVRFDSKKCGRVIKRGLPNGYNEVYDLGEYRTDWYMAAFEPHVESTVTIKDLMK